VAALLPLDAIAVAAAFALAYLIRFKLGLPLLETPPYRLHFYSTVVFAAVPVWLIVFAAYRLYDRQYLLGGFREYTAIVNACTIGMVAVIVGSFLEPTVSISRAWLLLAWILAIAIVGATRFTVRRIVYRLRRQGLFMDDAIIVGANEEGRALAEHLHATRVAGLRVVGAVDDGLPSGTPLAEGIQVIGRLKDLDALVQEHSVSELLVAPTALSRDDLLDVYRTVGRQRGIHLRMSSGLFEILTTGVSVKQVGGLTLISPEKSRITGVDAAMKAILDYAGAICGLLIASPLFALLALLIKLDSRGPVFHRRRVLGRGGNPFDALKFRTMVVNADEVLNSNPLLREKFELGFKLKDDPRITRVGRFLRRTSLDELPQLVNVLLGQMSLVGPRMIVPEEACRYGKWQLNLLTVKPGITGPWQVNGRSEISYDERVKLSMHYIRNYTIWLDLHIIFQTIPAVLLRKGAY
jgi:exopolysaccharide biosynthesis polyprenyl glycosylphosphotransferase